ncbi:MAG: ribonuclease P protein component [Candidatus Improbicoccus pseudotrichonymphae]|uniref:Ribonuclease P protein component n=1 Tax=Candidatus Improbicoccus pseudotrichonymphae TaxID=3033792 RepID=A0AA48KVD7_9FIRM|nr:MAG: ribonuclease P protein component [Candidatus Improbicoccus pseudotrichonymphae]
MNRDYLFRRTYNKGKKLVMPGLIVCILHNRIEKKRVGIVTNKKIGCAVERNRARRVIKNAYLNICKKLVNGIDLVFIARSKILDYKTGDVQKEMFFSIKNAGFFKFN